jgi:hypothetical protein
MGNRDSISGKSKKRFLLSIAFRMNLEPTAAAAQQLKPWK